MTEIPFNWEEENDRGGNFQFLKLLQFYMYVVDGKITSVGEMIEGSRAGGSGEEGR